MNTVLWIAQIVLALTFLAAGGMKVSRPRDQLVARLPWVTDFSDGQIKGIGALEIAGALGLIVPAITGIAPILVPVAATGLALMMVGAIRLHVRRGDGVAGWAPPLVLALMAVGVAWGRFGPYPL